MTFFVLGVVNGRKRRKRVLDIHIFLSTLPIDGVVALGEGQIKIFLEKN
jgi:hypothetical protein